MPARTYEEVAGTRWARLAPFGEVRAAMDRYFGTGPDGLPGNDDAGTLSAWFVFSAMGFYPVTPGLPEYPNHHLLQHYEVFRQL